MALYTAVQIDDPRNVINSVLHGIRPPVGAPERSMPRFAGSLDDAQLADLLVFVRSRFTDGPAWTDLPARIAQRRRQH
jgi:mono/diheme cytochrome c family protein